jgi:protease I
VDQDVVVCSRGINTIITSRHPDDLEPFCRELTAVFAQPPLIT